MARGQTSALQIERMLRGYADRGTFRSFSAAPGRGGKQKFTFEWLTDRRVSVVFDSQTSTLTFQKLLPNVPADSALYKDLKAFVRSRHDAHLPEHRRIDPAHAKAKCSNRRGEVSLSVSLRSGSYEYGCRCAVRLINELFLGFLKGPYAEYMVLNFNEPEE